VKAILVDARARAAWLQSLSVLNVAPVETGGVLFYRIPRDVLASYKDASPIAFEAKNAWLLLLMGSPAPIAIVLPACLYRSSRHARLSCGAYPWSLVRLSHYS
jgi:hypothetical protein